ncbi:MAG TPA: helix-turn-helix transcriptional regulator [Polyangiaceae bacterium]
MGYPAATRVIRDIGRRIAELRADRGWTQAHFAEVLGIAVPNLQRVEQGRQNLTVRTLVRVARKLGCHPRMLWEAPMTPRPKPGRPPAGKRSASSRG